MSGWRFVLAVAGTTAALAACREAAVSKAPACALTAEAVGAAAQRPIASENSHDLNNVLASYTNDAILIPPAGDVVAGQAAIRARYQSRFAGNTIRLTSEVVEARADGELGYARGFTLGIVTPERGGAPAPVNDKFLALLRCEAGEWRISHLMWSARGANP